MTDAAFDFSNYFAPRRQDSPGVTTTKDGSIVIEEPDGGVVIEFNPKRLNSEESAKDHDANLAEFIDDSELGAIASDLIEGVEEDRRSSAEWLQTRANGIALLGLKIENPRTDASSSAPLEGMSTVRHPLLAEACFHFQANAGGEFLPTEGKAKVATYGAQTAYKDQLADKLEKALDWYLTVKATEYVPDTDRLLFMTGFSGQSFKKVHDCPLRRRPVSEMVDAEDLVVNNTTVDMQTAMRVTHIIKMNQVTFKRMQLVGAYRDVEVSYPDANISAFEAAKARMEGINLNVTRPEDQDRTIYECYTFLDLPGFEHHRDDEPTGLPLPYRVTIDLTSREILEVRRDWEEGDEDFERKRIFVPFGFAPTFGFYCTGLLQILGNATTAVTGAWRLLLDAGMFSNFPGFLYAKTGAKQANNTFRIAPGSGAPVDVPGGVKLGDAIMPLPYKGPDPTLVQLVDNIAAAGQKLGGTAELPTAEGKADVPVGTMMAAIEQAGKILNAVHRRLHAAQAIEFGLLLNLLRKRPDVLIQYDPDDPTWTQELVLHALQNYTIVPRADPNTPSHVHRLMKATALGTIAQQTPPGVFDPVKVVRRILTMMQIDDVDDLFLPPQQGQQQPSPEEIKAQSTAMQNQTKLMDIQTRERETQMRLASQKELEQMRIAERIVTHPAGGALLQAETGQPTGIPT
jgi:hypothetical protein